MVSKEYRLSPLAETDLEDIWLYTLQKWSREQADTYVRLIVAAIENLTYGKAVGLQAPIREDYWKFFVESHTIYYTQNEEYLDVIRILHKRMDVEQYISTESQS